MSLRPPIPRILTRSDVNSNKGGARVGSEEGARVDAVGPRTAAVSRSRVRARLGPDIELACPRYYGAACHYVGQAEIDVAWTGPASLRVRATGPALDLNWTVTVRETFGLGLMNRLGRALPDWTWRPGPLVRARELMARHAFGLGDLRLSGTMPSGHDGVLMPKRMYWVAASRAVLNGRDLGAPTRLAECPTIGGVTVPARGVLAVGEAAWEPSRAGVRETLGLA